MAGGVVIVSVTVVVSVDGVDRGELETDTDELVDCFVGWAGIADISLVFSLLSKM